VKPFIPADSRFKTQAVECWQTHYC